MPLIENTSFYCPERFRNPHFQTVYPALLRQVSGVNYERERIATPDDDFLDLDWSKVGSKKIVLVLHGLEGDASKPYVRGMIRYFNDHNWDGIAINYRGCSGLQNKQLYSYHSGKTDDVDIIIRLLIENGYQQIVIVGFSMGGNLALKYAGEQGKNIPTAISHVISFCAPCDLGACARKIDNNRGFYLWQFLFTLRRKVAEKSKLFPDLIDYEKALNAKTFYEYDHHFTAVANGFESADDYYEKSSCLRYMKDISIPALLVSSADDPFLSPTCFPVDIAKEHSLVHLEITPYGGHLGFFSAFKKVYWQEQRAWEFVKNSQ